MVILWSTWDKLVVPAQVLGDICLYLNAITSLLDISAKALVHEGFNEPASKAGWLLLSPWGRMGTQLFSRAVDLAHSFDGAKGSLKETSVEKTSCLGCNTHREIHIHSISFPLACLLCQVFSLAICINICTNVFFLSFWYCLCRKK